MNYVGIIPARIGSTRLPGKALAMICGKPMIQRVYERAVAAIPDLWVATDSLEILERVESFGGRALMTSADAPDGTARCAEAIELTGCDDDTIIVNIQGDEPFVKPDDIKALLKCFEDPTVETATLARRFDPAEGVGVLTCPDNPKLVMDSRMNALYFSRSVIPYVRGGSKEEWPKEAIFYLHIGMYAYRARTLKKLAQLPAGDLFRAERLEQLRWLEAGYRIRVALVEHRTISVDTPEDLQRAIEHASITDRTDKANK